MLANTMQDMADDMIEPANATLRTLRRAQTAIPSAAHSARTDNGPRLQRRGPRDFRLDARELKLQGEQEDKPRGRRQQQAGQNDPALVGQNARRHARPHPQGQDAAGET